MNKVDSSVCHNCGEGLLPVSDAFCSFCREPIERHAPESRIPANHRHPVNNSLIAGIFAVILAMGLTVSIAGYVVVSVMALLAPPDVNDPFSGGVEHFTASIFHVGLRTFIVLVIAYILFCFGRARIFPDQYSAQSRLEKIVKETTHIDVSGVTEDNFYKNATDTELHSLYQSLKNDPKPERVPAMVYEARSRYRRNKSA